MYKKQPPKMLILNILDILKKYTDETHRLNRSEIIDILKKEYDMTVEPKTVRTNLADLIDDGYPIEYDVIIRNTTNPKTGKKEENQIWSNFYLEHDFTDSELRLLIDSLLFSNHISYNQCRDLVEKLEGLSNKYFRSHIKHIYAMKDIPPHNAQIFLNIETLDEAISSKKQVKFTYGNYGVDGKLHKRTDKNGKIREYIMNPYQMAAKDGRYYLICNRNNYKKISNYRVDLMMDIEMLDDPAVPFDRLEINAGGRLKLDDYIRKHIYMYSHEPINVKFRMDKNRLGDVIDRFGTDIYVYEETEDHVFIKANVDEMGMLQFAKSYAPSVVVISPKKMVDEIKKELRSLLEEYEG